MSWIICAGGVQIGPQEQLRLHLGAFLFVHHASHEKEVNVLSEGEKARLSLALLAAETPDVILLDELCNNLDVSSKQHVAEVLRAYPGTLILVSHEEAFAASIAEDLQRVEL